MFLPSDVLWKTGPAAIRALLPAAKRADRPDPAAASSLLMLLPAALVPAAAAAVIAPNLPTSAAAAATAPIVVIAAVVDGEEEPVPGIDGAGALLVTAGQLLVTAVLLGGPGGGEAVRLLGTTPSVQALTLLPHKPIILKLVSKIRYLGTSVGDPDPYVFGPPGSVSVRMRYGSGSRSLLSSSKNSPVL